MITLAKKKSVDLSGQLYPEKLVYISNKIFQVFRISTIQ